MADLIDRVAAREAVISAAIRYLTDDFETPIEVYLADAIAALPAQGWRVKPLEWEPSAINKPWHSARCPWGWYYAQWDEETQAWFASLEMGEVEDPIILQPQDVPTIDAAKAAAQADYERRILAALEPAEAGGVADDDPACTGCGGTGITYQTERRCACQPPAPVEALVKAATPTRDRLPEKPGLKSYDQIPCLIFVNGEWEISVWNCEHLCWDDADGDDYSYDPKVPELWLPLPYGEPLRAALAAIREGRG